MEMHCSICQASWAKPLYAGLVRCLSCGHVFSDSNLSEEQLFRLYGKEYFFSGEYGDYIANKVALQKNFRQYLKVLKKFIQPLRHRRLLEIGCAYGFFLDIAKEYFDIAQGIDITDNGIVYAREQLKLDVVKGDFVKYDFSGHKFDVVCMWDTIEHLKEPQLYLEKASNHMGSGALIAITTGDIESINARMRRDKWRLIHPPTHLHYFSRKTLARILDNYGFEIIYNCYCGLYRSIDNMAHRILVLNKRNPSIYNLLRRCGLTKLNFYSNLFDTMYVIARKH